MAWLAASAPYLQTAGTVLSAYGSIQQGNAAADAGASEARQLAYRAGQTRASTQRGANDARRQGRYIVSRGRAIAAKSGAGVTDPTVINTLADVSAEGEYAALTRMYEGEDSAQGMEATARARKREGNAAQTSGYLRAASTVLNQGVSLWDKYGK